MQEYDNTVMCGLVWTANFVAYRCITCRISQCMSLCADCFRHGNHEGHDYNMFKSQAGGACDCGDSSVMRESGFCSRHGPNASRPPPGAPPELMCVAVSMLPRMILRLLQHLRDRRYDTSLHTSIVIMDVFFNQSLLQHPGERRLPRGYAGQLPPDYRTGRQVPDPTS